MKSKIQQSLQKRVEAEISVRNPLKFLQELDTELLLNSAISVIYLYTRVSRGSKRKEILLSEVICGIGHSVRSKAGLRKDSALAAKAGAFILFSFEAYGLLEVKKGPGPSGHGAYLVEVKNDDGIVKLWETLPTDKAEKLPSLTPYAPWEKYRHETGMTIVKTSNKEVLEQLTPETHPIVFATLNKAQAVGWQINKDVFSLVNWALRNKADAFADIWEIQNAEAKQSKMREANAVASIAKRFNGSVFYHLYYFDFR